MRKIIAIFKKQLKDTLKNKMVLLQFAMFPLLAVFMTNTITLPDTPPDFFVRMFAVMYIGMAPLTAMGAILAEEKEKNTLLSILSGAAIGVHCKNQMSATSLSIPFMLALSLLPMISMFNEKVGRISRFLYSQQLNNLMDSVANPGLNGKSLLTIAVNALVIAVLFALAYRKCGLT